MHGRHRLILYALPSWRGGLDERAARIAEGEGIEARDLRLKLLKPGVTVQASAGSAAALEPLRQRLAADDIPAAVVADEAIREIPRPERAASLRSVEGALDLLDWQERVVLRLDGASDLLIVLADTKTRPERLLALLERGDHVDHEARVREMLRGAPVLRLFERGSEDGAILVGRRFNFRSMGEAASLSANQNMGVLFQRLLATVGRARIELDFGLGDQLTTGVGEPLPGTEERLEDFERHARIVRALWERGIPLRDQDVEGAATTAGAVGGRAPVAPPSAAQPRPLPREALRSARRGPGRVVLPPGLRKALEGVGPVWLQLPLLMATVGLVVAGVVTESRALFGASLVAASGVFFTLGLASWRRRRVILDFPTSRIRGLAMGKVEIAGTAHARYRFKTPYSAVDCVYYHFRVEELETMSDGSRYWRTVMEGESPRLPFEVDDGSGRALVNPQGAQFEIQEEDTQRGLATARGSRALLGGELQQRAIERFIPEGARVYVLGTATPLGPEPTDRRDDLRARLAALKRDRAEMVARFDLDGDGKIDAQEWDLAVAEVERELFVEQPSREAEERDTLMIAAGQPGSLFLISDRDEQALTRDLLWRQVGGLVAGFTALALGLTWLA
jgi:hypothetical protein